MNTKDLLELTVLDSAGLLEPHELETFEEALASASEPMLAQVREEQSRLSGFLADLPEVEPRAELRELVLESYRREFATAPAARSVTHDRGRSVPHVSRGKRVSWVWRASAVGLAVALVGLSVGMIRMQADYAEFQNQVQSAEFFERIGVEYADALLFDRDTHLAKFTLTGAESAAEASVIYSSDKSTARLFHNNLGADDGGLFHLVVLDEDGQVVRSLASFEADGRFNRVDVRVDMTTDTRLAVTRDLDSDRPDTILQTEISS